MNAPKDAKRQEIKDRIAAAQTRNERRREASFTDTVGEKAIAAKDGFTSFAKEHPVATVAGGLALGVLIAGMFKGPRRAAASGGAKAVGLAAIGAEIASAFMSSALDSAQHAGRTGADKLGALGESMGDTARSLKREAGHRAGGAGDSVRKSARSVGKSVSRSLRRH